MEGEWRVSGGTVEGEWRVSGGTVEGEFRFNGCHGRLRMNF